MFAKNDFLNININKNMPMTNGVHIKNTNSLLTIIHNGV